MSTDVGRSCFVVLIYIYTYIYIYIYIYIMYIHVCIYMYIYIHTYIYTYIYGQFHEKWANSGVSPPGGAKIKKSSYLIVVNFMSSLCMKAYSGKVGHTNLQYCLSYLHFNMNATQKPRVRF